MNDHSQNKKSLAAAGFEPAPPRRLVPKTSALDHSATLPSDKLYLIIVNPAFGHSIANNYMVQLSQGYRSETQLTDYHFSSMLCKENKNVRRFIRDARDFSSATARRQAAAEINGYGLVLNVLYLKLQPIIFKTFKYSMLNVCGFHYFWRRCGAICNTKLSVNTVKFMLI